MNTTSISEQELKRDRIADKELNTEQYYSIDNVMNNIERLRKERKKKCPYLTQDYLARKSGISLATYKNYLSGASDNITLKTLINIAQTLNCDVRELLKPANIGGKFKKRDMS